MDLIQPLVAIDQFANTLIYIDGDGWGKADETISARAWRCYLQDKISDRLYLTIDRIFFWQENHCFKGWRAEWDRKQYPDHYRTEEPPCATQS